MNLLGLGFAFSAVDKGLGKILTGSSEGFTQLGRSFETAAALAEHFTSSGMRLTTEYESNITQMDTASRRLGSRIALVGDSVDKMSKHNAAFAQKATSMGLSLNMSAGEASEAVAAFEALDKSIQKVSGIRNAQQLAKLSAVTGVSSKDMRDELTALNTLFGKDTKSQQAFIGAMMESGKQMNDVTGSFHMGTIVMDQMRRAQQLGMTNVADFGNQVFATAAILRKYVGSADEARQLSLQLGESFINSKEQMRALFTGAANEMPQFVKEFAISTGDIQKAMADMDKGPAAMIKSLAELAQKGSKDPQKVAEAFTFFAGRMEQVLGPKLTAVLTKTMKEEGPEAIQVLINKMNDAKVNLGEFGDKMYTTGRTLDESFKLMEQGFLTRFRQIGVGSGRELLKNVRQSFSKWGDEMAAIAKDPGNPMSAIISTLSKMQVLGPIALVPEDFQGAAMVLGNLGSSLGPMISQFNNLKELAFGLINPFNLLAVSIGAIYGIFKHKLMKGLDLREAKIQTVKQVSDFIKDIIRALTGFGKESTSLGGMLKKEFMEIPDILKGIWDDISNSPEFAEGVKVFTNLMTKILNGLEQFWTTTLAPRLKELFEGFTSGLFGGGDQASINTTFGRIGLWVGGALKSAAEKAMELLDKALPVMLEEGVNTVFRAIQKLYADHPALVTAYLVGMGAKTGLAAGPWGAAVGALIGLFSANAIGVSSILDKGNYTGPSDESKAGRAAVDEYLKTHKRSELGVDEMKVYQDAVEDFRRKHNQIPDFVKTGHLNRPDNPGGVPDALLDSSASIENHVERSADAAEESNRLKKVQIDQAERHHRERMKGSRGPKTVPASTAGTDPSSLGITPEGGPSYVF